MAASPLSFCIILILLFGYKWRCQVTAVGLRLQTIGGSYINPAVA